MSSNFIPILSTSPPPLDGDVFEDDDDDFGEFAAVREFDGVSENICSPSKSDRTNVVEKIEGEKECQNIDDIAVNGLEQDDFGDFSSFENHFPKNGVCANNVIYSASTLDEPDPALCGNVERHKDFSKKVCFKESSESDVEKQEPLGRISLSSDDVTLKVSGVESSSAGRLVAQDGCQIPWHSDQQDNTSQDSVTDSGLCSSSQRSEASPLPQSETGFSDVETQQKLECTTLQPEPGSSKESIEPCPEKLSGDLVSPQKDGASSGDVMQAYEIPESPYASYLENGVTFGDDEASKSSTVPEVNVSNVAEDEDDFEEFGGFSAVSYTCSEDFSSARDLSFVTNDDAAMETARTSFESSCSARAESLGTPGDDLSPLPDDAVAVGSREAESGESAQQDNKQDSRKQDAGSEKWGDGFEDESDDWDDFTDFEGATSLQSEAKVVPCESSEGQERGAAHLATPLKQTSDAAEDGGGGDGDDDFADFEQVKFVEASADGNFADFSSASFDKPSCSWDVSETKTRTDLSFGDWSKAQVEVVSHTSSEDGSHVQSKLAQLLVAAFPSQLQENVEGEPPLVVYENAENSILGVRPSKSRVLWDQLQDFEQTPALCYRWANSHVFQQVLHSLDIDSRNILRNPSIPIFASLGLGLLEPIKGPLPTSKTPENTAEDISNNTNTTAEMVIPPVHFDWSGSGLINPLESETSSSVLLDLDFFYTNDPTLAKSDTAPKTSSLEDELLGPDPISPKLPPVSGNGLEKLLSSTKTTILPSKQQARPSDISEEAKQVLDQLPDLSFMQAKVLMFPIKADSAMTS